MKQIKYLKDYNLKIGDKINNLEIISEIFRDNKQSKIFCKCMCGNICVVYSRYLIKKRNISCGCSKKKPSVKTHRMSHTKIYSRYYKIKDRCYSITNPSYKNYGGRGIVMSEEWKNDFSTFYKWCVESGYREDLTIERVDVNKGYEPSNCIWIPLSDQSYNRRRNKLTSKHRGVYKNKDGKCRSVIAIKGKSYHIGIYETEEEAAIAYNKKSIELRGLNAFQNKIQGDI